MRANDRQVLQLWKERARGFTIAVAALRSGMHRNTASKYLRDQRAPSVQAAARTWRTHPDPFAADWPRMEERLAEAPGLDAKTLFEELLAQAPECYHAGQLRTFQRRVKTWRATKGPEREVFFAQEHRPGEASQTDFTWASELGVTIGGEPHPHQLCHVTLPYSNWSWATPCRSESMAALFEGMQEALWRLGGVPEYSQTDNSTAATHDLRSGKRAFNAQYLAFVNHYGMKPRTIGIGEKEQNGDVEASNGALKRHLEQQLLVRGSRDFESEAAYRAWLAEVLDRRNRQRGPRLAEERAHLRPLPARRVPSWREIEVRVGQGTTIRVMGNAYSVPSRLMGERVKVKVHETRLEVLLGGEVRFEMERLQGRGRHLIQYRHVISSLVRKPGAFRLYRYREALFPTEVFRRAYDALVAALSAWAADGEYLRIVDLAAKTMESDVEAALGRLLVAKELPTFERVRSQVVPAPPAAPALEVPTVNLAEYDALIEETAGRVAS
jgi:transposase